jgi:hypothetical protein
MTTPTCCGGQPMRERPTLTHGVCYVCAVCGLWQSQHMTMAKHSIPGHWGFVAPPEALNHRQPSSN